MDAGMQAGGFGSPLSCGNGSGGGGRMRSSHRGAYRGGFSCPWGGRGARKGGGVEEGGEGETLAGETGKAGRETEARCICKNTRSGCNFSRRHVAGCLFGKHHQ